MELSISKIYVVVFELYDNHEIKTINRTLEGAIAELNKLMEQYNTPFYEVEICDTNITEDNLPCNYVYEKETEYLVGTYSIEEHFLGD